MSRSITANNHFWAPRKNGGDRPRKVHFSQLRKLGDLDLRSGWGHTGVHMWSRSTNTPNYMEIGKTFCRRTEGRTGLQIVDLLGHRRGDDLKGKSKKESKRWGSEWTRGKKGVHWPHAGNSLPHDGLDMLMWIGKQRQIPNYFLISSSILQKQMLSENSEYWIRRYWTVVCFPDKNKITVHSHNNRAINKIYL